MKDVFYANPFIPREWIAAHGLRPRGILSALPFKTGASGIIMGACPFAEALSQTTAEMNGAVVFAAGCDQMRRAVNHAVFRSGQECFLMNLPSTWQTPVSKQLYRSELERLGSFLKKLGGRSPSREILAAEMRRQNKARKALRKARPDCSGRQFAEAMNLYHRNEEMILPAGGVPKPAEIPLAIIGESIPSSQLVLFDWIEMRGGRVTLDATTFGERSLLKPFHESSFVEDPFEALVCHYFEGMIDVFQRPDARLYEWLRPRIEERGIRGIILWHYACCDLWRAMANRIREEFHLPLLHLDASDTAVPAPSMKTRLEAFLEILGT